MGIGGISFWQILIILVVILILFGGKKIRTMGSDLGESLKGFKKAIKDEDSSKILNLNQTINKNCYKLDFLRF
jgi:sec-independent protein translocase protein TatA